MSPTAETMIRQASLKRFRVKVTESAHEESFDLFALDADDVKSLFNSGYIRGGAGLKLIAEPIDEKPSEPDSDLRGLRMDRQQPDRGSRALPARDGG
jgi:hypothetical protein